MILEFNEKELEILRKCIFTCDVDNNKLRYWYDPGFAYYSNGDPGEPPSWDSENLCDGGITIYCADKPVLKIVFDSNEWDFDDISVQHSHNDGNWDYFYYTYHHEYEDICLVCRDMNIGEFLKNTNKLDISKFEDIDILVEYANQGKDFKTYLMDQLNWIFEYTKENYSFEFNKQFLFPMEFFKQK